MLMIITLSTAKNRKKSCFVECLSKNAADANVPNESDINMEKMQIEFTKGICVTGNQFTTNLFGLLSMKQKPKPVINVPAIKKLKL